MTELSFIDSGIENIRDIGVPDPRNLRSLNLFSNRIARIEALENFTSLVELNLSSNQIRKIENLGSLVNLRTLNLSCNKIVSLEGLAPLTSLKKLVVSFNRIESLAGLSEVRGPLAHLDLRGNRVQSIRELSFLSYCPKLTEVLFQQDDQPGRGNPVCSHPQYKVLVATAAPSVTMLDGRPVRFSSSGAKREEHPVVESYLDLIGSDLNSGDLESETSLSEVLQQVRSTLSRPLESQQDSRSPPPPQPRPNIATPRIDTAISSFRSRRAPVNPPSPPPQQPPPPPQRPLPADGRSDFSRTAHELLHSLDHEVRIEKIENRLSHVIPAIAKVADVVLGGDQGSPPPPSPPSPQQAATRTAAPAPKRGGRVAAGAPRPAAASPSPRAPSASDVAAKRAEELEKELERRKQDAEAAEARIGDLEEENERMKEESSAQRQRTADREQALKDHILKLAEELESAKIYARQREAELDSEVQRRMRSETKLAEVSQDIKRRNEALRQITKSTTLLEQENQKLKTRVESLEQEIVEHASAKEREEGLKKALKEAQEAAEAAQQERLQASSKLSSRVEDSQARIAQLEQQLDARRQIEDQLRAELQSERDKLRNADELHRTTLDEQRTLHDREMRALMEREAQAKEALRKDCERSLGERDDLHSKLVADTMGTLGAQTKEERDKREELARALESCARDCEDLKQALKATMKKELRASAVVAELSEVVREQKQRIAQLTRSKQDAVSSLQDALRVCEEKLKTLGQQAYMVPKLQSQMDLMRAEVKAKEDAVLILKQDVATLERALTEKDTYHNRKEQEMKGRISELESQARSLTDAVQSKDEALKVKGKVLDDFEQTVISLKQSLRAKEEELANAISHHGHEMSSLEAEVQSELETAQHTCNRLEEKILEQEAMIEELSTSCAKYKGRSDEAKALLRERDEMLRFVEGEIQKLRDMFSEKEKVITAERDAAVLEVQQCQEHKKQLLEQVARVEGLEAAVQQLQGDCGAKAAQLAAQTAEFEKLQGIVQQKSAEVEEANRKLAVSESELKVVLKALDKQKEAAETFLSQLLGASSSSPKH